MNSQDYYNISYQRQTAQYPSTFSTSEIPDQPDQIQSSHSNPNFQSDLNGFSPDIQFENQQLGAYANYGNVPINHHSSYAYSVSSSNTNPSSSTNFNQTNDEIYRKPVHQQFPRQIPIENRLLSANIPFVNITSPNALTTAQNDTSTRYGTLPKDMTRPFKRPRRRHDEIDRYYSCNFEGCTKSYGTLNHLNAHTLLQKHGPKRKPSEFKELKKIARVKRKEQQMLKAVKEFSQRNNLMFISLSQNQPIPQAGNHVQPTLNSPGLSEVFASSPEDSDIQTIKMEYNEPSGLGVPINGQQYIEPDLSLTQLQLHYQSQRIKQTQLQNHHPYHQLGPASGPASRSELPVPNYKNM